MADSANGLSSPDVRTAYEQLRQLNDPAKYLQCLKDLEEVSDQLSSPLQAPEPNWELLTTKADALGIKAAFLDTKVIFLMNRPFLAKKDSFAIAIYSKDSWLKRKAFTVNLLNSDFHSFNIEHGKGDFGNSGHYQSSLGCFFGGMNFRNFAFTLYGFDGSLNDKACERRLQVHISQSASEDHPASRGCITVGRRDEQAYSTIATAVSGGGLICAFDEGRVPESHRRALGGSTFRNF